MQVKKLILKCLFFLLKSPLKTIAKIKLFFKKYKEKKLLQKMSKIWQNELIHECENEGFVKSLTLKLEEKQIEKYNKHYFY